MSIVTGGAASGIIVPNGDPLGSNPSQASVTDIGLVPEIWNGSLTTASYVDVLSVSGKGVITSPVGVKSNGSVANWLRIQIDGVTVFERQGYATTPTVSRALLGMAFNSSLLVSMRRDSGSGSCLSGCYFQYYLYD